MPADYVQNSLTNPNLETVEDEVLLRFVQVSDTHIFDSTTSQRLKKYSDQAQLPPGILEAMKRLEIDLPETADTPHSAKVILERINALPLDIDFVLHTGDVGFDPEDGAEYAPIKQIFANSRFPVYFIPGNHDSSDDLQQHLSHLEAMQPTFDYEIPHPHVQIVCLDSSRGIFNEQQLAWLEARITADDERPLIVALHHNLISYGEFFGDMVILRNHAAARAILQKAKARLRGVFYGHMHMILDVVLDGITYYCCPSGWVQFDVFPYADVSKGNDGTSLVGINVVTITRNATFVRRMPIEMS